MDSIQLTKYSLHLKNGTSKWLNLEALDCRLYFRLRISVKIARIMQESWIIRNLVHNSNPIEVRKLNMIYRREYLIHTYIMIYILHTYIMIHTNIYTCIYTYKTQKNKLHIIYVHIRRLHIICTQIFILINKLCILHIYTRAHTHK